MNQKDQISSIHLGLFILAGQIGLGIITFPSALSELVGHDGWISLLLTGLFAIGATSLIMLLLRRYQDLSIYEINRLLFGKWLGQSFNFLLLSYLLFLAAVGLRLFSEFIRLFHLTRIPPPIITVLIILPTILLTKKGLRAIGRFSYFIPVVLVAGLILAFKLFGDLRISFLKPVGAAGWPALMKAIPTLVFTFIGLELPVFLYPAVKDRRQAMRWAVTANIISLLFFELVYVCSVGIFGEVMLKRIVAPLFSLSRYIEVPIVERVDLFFFLLWFPLLESTFRAYFATAYEGTKKLFHLKETYLSLILFTLALVVLSLIPTDLNQAFQLGDLVNYSGMAVIFYLIACFAFSFIRQRGVSVE
jgi:spore germination protein (amino acid permease)